MVLGYSANHSSNLQKILAEAKVLGQDADKKFVGGFVARKDTFFMIKPDATARNLQRDIQEHLISVGFQIVGARTLTLEDRAAGFLYLEHSEKEFFNDLVAYTTSGPVQLLWLRYSYPESDAVAVARNAVAVLRKIHGVDKRRNSVHSSDSDEAAARELSYFFNWSP